MKLFYKEQGHIGVDIGAHGIKVVELYKKKDRPLLWTYGILDQRLDIHIPDPPAEVEMSTNGQRGGNSQKKIFPANVLDDRRVKEYGGLLKTLLKQSNVTSTHATASLPVSYIFHAVVTLPRVDKKDVDRLVRAEIKKMLSRPVEEMQVVHQEIPSVTNPGTDANVTQNTPVRYLVTAAPKELIGFYSTIFAGAGLELRELETEAFALERSLVGKDTGTVMVVDIGAERTNFFIIDQSLPITHRSIQMGGDTINEKLAEMFDIDMAVAGKIKYDIARLRADFIQTDAFFSITDPIIKEIEYSFDLFLHQSGHEEKRPEKIILTGGSALFPFIQKDIARAFPMKVFVGDPWAHVVYQQDLKTILGSIGPRMAVSIGLALRHFND